MGVSEYSAGPFCTIQAVHTEHVEFTSTCNEYGGRRLIRNNYTYQATRPHIAEVRNLHSHRLQNLKSQTSHNY
jgi:hypothetical protein